MIKHKCLICAKVLSVNWKNFRGDSQSRSIRRGWVDCLAMLPQSEHVQEAESCGSTPKCITGSAANWHSAGFDADLVMRSEPNEDAEQ